MMLNCDPRDRFVDQYLKLMIDSFLAHLWVPKLDFIHIYLKYERDAIRFLSDLRVRKFILYRLRR